MLPGSRIAKAGPDALARPLRVSSQGVVRCACLGLEGSDDCHLMDAVMDWSYVVSPLYLIAHPGVILAGALGRPVHCHLVACEFAWLPLPCQRCGTLCPCPHTYYVWYGPQAALNAFYHVRPQEVVTRSPSREALLSLDHEAAGH